VLERRQVDLRGLVRSQIEEIQTLTHDTEVRLRSELPEAPVEALVDPDRLAQALTNLLSNALRFARSSVRVQLGVDSAAARIEVEDDGPGIPDQELPRIFERFARIQAHGAKSGTGLGLSIARSLVEAHGGRVQAENRFEPGGIAPLGARFVLCLPLGGGS
jgi:signal transduction histidine kinase